VLAQAPVVRPLPRFDGYFRTELNYDDNVFRYSAEDLDAFRMSEEPERFPIRSADDLDVAVSGGLKLRYSRGRRWGNLRLRVKLHGFASNWQRSYGWARLEAYQSVWRGGRVAAGLLWMPSHLIRYYRSHTAPEQGFQGCRFTEYLATVSLRQRFGRVYIEPRYRYEVDDYLPAFDYYDTRAHRIGAEAGLEVVSGLEVAVDYEFKSASADGPVPDISYRQHEGHVEVTTRPRPFPRLEVTAGFGVELRGYTTANSAELDPVHAEREDIIESFSLELAYRVGPAKVLARYGREWRETESPYSERIEDIKQYSSNRFRLGAVVSPAGLFTGR
jgi:hypothetical protein